MKLWIFPPGLFTMILTLFNVILACDSFQNGRYKKKIYRSNLCCTCRKQERETGSVALISKMRTFSICRVDDMADISLECKDKWNHMHTCKYLISSNVGLILRSSAQIQLFSDLFSVLWMPMLSAICLPILYTSKSKQMRI